MSDDAHFYRCLHYRYTLFQHCYRSSRSAHPSPVDLLTTMATPDILPQDFSILYPCILTR